MTDHALARRLDDLGQTGAKHVTVPSELLREVAFEIRELVKERDAALAKVRALLGGEPLHG